MVVDCVPRCVRNIANDAKDLCNNNFTYNNFVTLLCALLFGISSYSDIVRAFVFAQSVSTLSRSGKSIPSQKLLRRSQNRVAAMILETENYKDRFILITDDTLMRKFGVTPDNCYWFDHCTNSCFKGRNYLVLVVFDTFTGQSFPVSVVLLKGKKHQDYQPRLDVLKTQLLVLKNAGFGELTLCADSWFADKKLFAWLNDNGFAFEIEIKSNRKITHLNNNFQGKIGNQGKIVYPSISDVACTLKRNTAFSGGAPKRVASGVVHLFGADLRLKFAAVWNIGDTLQDKPFAVYVTNKTSFSAGKIWALSRFRWGIECHFRKSKQDFSFDAFPTHSSTTAYGLIVLGMFLICSLELMRFDRSAVLLTKQEQKKKYIALSTWVKKIRAETEDFSLKRAMFMSDKRKSLLEHLGGRKNARYACSKPRDKYNIRDVIENEKKLRLSVA